MGEKELTLIHQFRENYKTKDKNLPKSEDNETKINFYQVLVLDIWLFLITNSLSKLLPFLLGRGSAAEIKETK